MATPVSESEMMVAIENYSGWCTKCCEFTHDSSEPDARGYRCPQCDNFTVMGAEQALIEGEIEIS